MQDAPHIVGYEYDLHDCSPWKSAILFLNSERVQQSLQQSRN